MPLPVLPAPVTWSAGVIPAPQLRADVSDCVALLRSRPMFVGQQTTGQSIATSAETAVTLDAELFDNWNGHQVSTASSKYFGMFAGWYLAEGSVPLSFTGGTNTMSALIGGVQNAGTATNFGGQRLANDSGRQTVATAAKLMKMQQVGTFNGAGNDYVQLIAYQGTGSSQTLSSDATKFPYLHVRWVSALSGTQPLAVPANPAWPPPPSYITSSFLNANIRDTIRFLVYPPVFECAQNSAQSLASATSVPATGTTITMGSGVVVDNYGAYSTSTSTWTAPVAGVYYCYGVVGLTVGANTVSMGAGLTVSSANYNNGTAFTIWGGTMNTLASAVQANNVRRRLRLNAGDTIKLAGFQRDSTSAAATVNNSGDWQPRLIIVWEAA